MRATSAGSRAVARLYRPRSSLWAARGASSAAFTSGQTVPAGSSRCRCAPAHLPACENLSATENAGLDPVAGVVAEHGAYREGVRPQRIQCKTEL